MRSGTGNAQAEEIVQDVMLTVWRKAHLFDPQRAQVSSWIYQVARNRQIDIIRRESRPVPEELKPPDSTDEDASQIIALDQEAQQLRQALARLKPGQREMVEKAYLGDLTHAEIKAETGLPLGTIKSRIRLGLEKLRHELKDLRSPSPHSHRPSHITFPSRSWPPMPPVRWTGIIRWWSRHMSPCATNAARVLLRMKQLVGPLWSALWSRTFPRIVNLTLCRCLIARQNQTHPSIRNRACFRPL
jgi:RNA polymerase sigma-70 factor (ECF subfamily)